MNEKKIIKDLRKALIANQMQFTDNCFDILYSGCSTPSQMYSVFKLFILSILANNSEIKKKDAIDGIFTSIRKSSYLLDSLLSALYEWNLSLSSSSSDIHNYLNEELTKKDWSRLGTPSIVQPPDQIDPEKLELVNNGAHAINQCIYEIVFSHTPVDVLACSQFIGIKIDSTLDFLTTDSLNRFADALIIRYINQPVEIFKRLGKKNLYDVESKLAISIFRSRDIGDINQITDKQIFNDTQFNLLINHSDLNSDSRVYFSLKKTLTFNNNNPSSAYDVTNFIPMIKEIYEQLNIKQPKDTVFPFFSILVLPNADYFDDSFIQAVIKCSIFPSSNPNFPDELFRRSEKCQKFVTIKVLFDIFKKSGVEDIKDFEKSFVDAYQNIIVPVGHNVEEYKIEIVLESIFSSYICEKIKDDRNISHIEFEKINKANDFINNVFIWFISNNEEITPLLMHKCIASFINQYYEAVCILALQAIHNMTKIELFLNSKTLSTFFDQIFANFYQNYNLNENMTDANNESNDFNQSNINPKLALDVIYEVSINHFADDAVTSFWDENIAIFIDTIMNNHPLTADLFQFLQQFLKNCNEEFVNRVLSFFVDDFDIQDNCSEDRAINLLSQFLKIH